MKLKLIGYVLWLVIFWLLGHSNATFGMRLTALLGIFALTGVYLALLWIINKIQNK